MMLYHFKNPFFLLLSVSAFKNPAFFEGYKQLAIKTSILYDLLSQSILISSRMIFMIKKSDDQSPIIEPVVRQQHTNQNHIGRLKSHPLFIEAALVLLLLIVIGGGLYYMDLQSKIYIEKSEISAPIISIGPQSPGVLDKIYVQEDDLVSQGQKLFQVGDQTIQARSRGLIVSVQNTPGQLVSPQTPVVQLIDPSQMRVVGQIAEDKGLSSIHPGQKVMFTVDAFGSKEYWGTVESISPIARQSDIVFSISDKREEREFDVRVIFDTSAAPELKDGMSAKMWIYK